MVARYHPQHVPRFVLEELDPTLSARCQVVTVRIVKTIAQVFFKLIDILTDIMDNIHL
jgi:hypothetical protein